MKARFRIPDQLLMPWSPQQTISVQRASEMLNVSKWTVLRMIQSGEILGYQVRKLERSPFRVHYDSVIKYIDKMHEENGMERRFSL